MAQLQVKPNGGLRRALALFLRFASFCYIYIQICDIHVDFQLKKIKIFLSKHGSWRKCATVQLIAGPHITVWERTYIFLQIVKENQFDIQCRISDIELLFHDQILKLAKVYIWFSYKRWNIYMEHVTIDNK